MNYAKGKMQDDALQLDNRDGRNLGQLEIAQIQSDRFETDSKTFQAYEKILHKLYDYEKVSLKFLLGDERRSPPTDLLKEALAISGNFDAIRKVFKQDKNDEALQHFQAQNPNHSVKVNLLRKKLFILAEKLTPSETQEVIYSLADGNFGPVDQQIELYFESLIKSDKLSLYHSEKLRKVLLDLKLTDLYKIFSDSSVRDDQLYKINPNNVGTCIIINQKLYKEGLDLKSRLGTDLDCSRLEETFTLFGYKVNVFHNVKFSKMAPTLKEVRDNIEDKCSSLIVCILAHGRKDVIICPDGLVFPIEDIKEIFDATKCRALMGKPKMFFIQACQGDEKLAASSSEEAPVPFETDNGPNTVSTSKSYEKFTDYFTYLSSVAGTASFRHTQEGTFFVKTLCSSFLLLDPSMGLHDICSRVQRMTTSMKATINGTTCAMVPEKRDSLERNVIFHVKQECLRPAAKMRLKRVLMDMCIERMIKERLMEKM